MQIILSLIFIFSAQLCINYVISNERRYLMVTQFIDRYKISLNIMVFSSLLSFILLMMNKYDSQSGPKISLVISLLSAGLYFLMRGDTQRQIDLSIHQNNYYRAFMVSQNIPLLRNLSLASMVCFLIIKFFI